MKIEISTEFETSHTGNCDEEVAAHQSRDKTLT